MKKKSEIKNDLGDFQTPSSLADKICLSLKEKGINPMILLEPTCGEGNFVISALKTFDNLRYIYCVDVQPKYEQILNQKIQELSVVKEQQLKIDINKIRIDFYQDSIFNHKYKQDFMEFLAKIDNTTPVPTFLILGNPPWVTNTELSLLDSANIPQKSNYKKERGINAITGKGNFDIAEYIMHNLLVKFHNYKGNMVMICKNTVVKNIVKDQKDSRFHIGNIIAFQFNAKKMFNINADASILKLDMGVNPELYATFKRFDENNNDAVRFGWVNNQFVSNIELYTRTSFLEGDFPFTWRQGIKHDLIKVMILEKIGKQSYKNGLGEKYQLEDELIYPFLKGSQVYSKDSSSIEETQYIIIPQKELNQETDYIKRQAPLLWEYLQDHKPLFEHRKSRIYANKPAFSIFGIGDYAFNPFKIVVPGFYKDLKFVYLQPILSKPVMVDDTCYYISFAEEKYAKITWAIMNSPIVKDYFMSIVFRDAKRPYTKEILGRLSLHSLLGCIKFDHLKSDLDPSITQQDFEKYKNRFI